MNIDACRNIEPFHIAFGVDERFLYPMGVTIASIIKNNPGMKFVFHVFTSSMKGEHEERLLSIEKNSNHKIMIHMVDRSLFEKFWDFNHLSHFSPAIFTRILIPQALQHITDRVLYLDADILCLNDMSELANMDMTDTVAAVVDDDEKSIDEKCERLKIKSGRYFNSGFILINIRQWISNEITEKTMKCMAESNNSFLLPDQDALNIVLDEKTKYIDRKWNYLYRLVSELRAGRTKNQVPAETVFVHFVGWLKPWREWNRHESKSLFLSYQVASPWMNHALHNELPKNFKEMHIYSLINLREGKVLNGLFWFYKYMINKYLKK